VDDGGGNGRGVKRAEENKGGVEGGFQSVCITPPPYFDATALAVVMAAATLRPPSKLPLLIGPRDMPPRSFIRGIASWLVGENARSEHTTAESIDQ
jgi:hypothetical protein